MRAIEWTARFRQDYRRVAVGRHRASLDTLLRPVLSMLAADEPLPPACRDHALAGNWSDHRDCHLKPDLVLIYRKPDDRTLQLVWLGSHRERGL
jgi:mRNA interferase YafQ